MKKKIFIAGLTILSITFGAAVFAKFHLRPKAYQADEILVEATVVKAVNIPLEVNAIGTVVAKSVEITPALAGHVQKILFRDGSFVKQNIPLIQLDNAIYKAKYASATAQEVFSEATYKRMRLLGKRGVIAKQAIEQAEADFKEKRAAAQENEVILNKMLLKAPFAGVVGKTKVNPGDYVTVGQGVVTLTDIKHLRIEYNVPEKYLPLLKGGQEVKITTATYPEKIFVGNLLFISPTINTDNRSISLYAEIANENNLLAAGMFVDVAQSLGTEEQVLMIPARSLVPILDGEEVYKIVNGKAFATSIVIGKRIGESVQVIEGLSPGDMIITDGQLKVRNGAPVTVKVKR